MKSFVLVIIVLFFSTISYAGEKDFGLKMGEQLMKVMALDQGHAWDLPNIIYGDTGKRVFGTDYYQNMMLWAPPASIYGEDIARSCQKDSLIGRVIQAGNPE